MAYRTLAKSNERFQGPTAPRKRFVNHEPLQTNTINSESTSNKSDYHPLTNLKTNITLKEYEFEVKGRFDQIVPFLKKISGIQNEQDFVDQAQNLATSEISFELNTNI